MRTAGIFEAKQNFSALVDAVEAGDEVVITRHGKEVARIVPVADKAARLSEDRIRQELLRMQELRARVKPGPGWKELRDEGRRF